MTKSLVIVLVTLVAAHRARAAKKPAEPTIPLTYSVPSAAAPGASTEVEFFGEDLGKSLGLWTSFPAEVTPVAADGKIKYQLKLPLNAAVGIGAVRLATSSGASSLQLFMIDDCPTVASTGKNVSPPLAQSVSPPVAIDGNSEPLATQYFRVTAKKSQRLAIEVVAERLGSRMDPVVRVPRCGGAGAGLLRRHARDWVRLPFRVCRAGGRRLPHRPARRQLRGRAAAPLPVADR